MRIFRRKAMSPARPLLLVAVLLLMALSLLLSLCSIAAAAHYVGSQTYSVATTQSIINPTTASGARGNALYSAGTDDGAKLLQFTSAGHMIGFTGDGVIVASASHMLRIDFLNSKAVAPEADRAVSQESNTGKASPLGVVTYRNAWDGVTMVYEASGTSIMKSTYYVDATKEGVQVDCIRLGYNRPVQIDDQGNLVINCENGTIVEGAPMAWQETEGRRKPVTVIYVLHGEREVGFALGDHASGIPVVIDPVMTWNTFLGGSGSGGYDNGYAIAVDSSGNVYVSGYSGADWGSPVRAYSGSDAFAAKLDRSGSLVWNTFLGGSGYEIGYAIAVDGSGNVYVGGDSGGATWGDNPVRAYTLYNDAFAAKLDNSGNLVWNTFLGGSGGEEGFGIAVDSSGNVYVCGYGTATWGDNPVRAYTLYNDGFAAKLDSSGALQWNTFLGGNALDEVGTAIAVDGSGNVYVGGYSGADWGTPVRAYTGGNDAFAAKLDSTTGSLVWNTFLGGSGGDHGRGIAVDGSGNVYIGGDSTADWGTPVRAYSGSDAFAAKLDSSGALIWNTFLGDSGADYGRGIAVDGSGNVYVGGDSDATWGSPVRTYSSSVSDAFAAKLESSGALQWNTFLGDSGADYGRGIAVDGSGNVYVGGDSTATWGSPVRAYSGSDAFAAKLDRNGNFLPGWASHTDLGRTDPEENTFASPNTTVYMKGTSFANVSYLIAYYDNDGLMIGSQTNSASSGILYSSYLLTSDPAAAAGDWHALVQPSFNYTGFGTHSYAEIVASPDTYGLLADDGFTVEPSALPEFPTVIAGIFVACACAGTYWWMRKRKNAGPIRI